MTLTDLEAALRATVRARLEKGALPREMPSSSWAGNGSGASCTVCDQAIREDELELEYELNGESLRFHRLCNAVWQLECERMARGE